MHAYLWGILISAFVVDIMKNKIKYTESIPEEYIDQPIPPSEGIKVTDGSDELKVVMDKPNYANNNANKFEIIPLTIQYW